MRCPRKIPTLLALLGLFLPWGKAMAISAHLSIADHEGSVADHVADLEHSFHGHGHTAERPDHRHPWIGVDLVGHRATLLRAITAPAQIHLALTAPASAGARVVVCGRLPLFNDHGPPGTAARRAILRI